LALKFGDYKAGEFSDLMRLELHRINKNPVLKRMEKRNEKANISKRRFNTKSSDSKFNDRVNRQGERTRLPASQSETYKRKRQILNKNSKRRHLQPSVPKVKKPNARDGFSSKGKNGRSKDFDIKKLQSAKKAVKKLKRERGPLVAI
jgi:hypothetical protein